MINSASTIGFKKKIVFLLFAYLIGMLFLVLFLELFTRIFFPQELFTHPKNLYISSSTVGYKLNPGFDAKISNEEYTSSISINSIGIRDREVLPKKENDFRILGLGDSFTFAQQVDSDQIYLNQIEQNIDSLFSDINIDIFNSGVNGYGTEHEYHLLKIVGPIIAPDLVVLGFYIGNDINDNLIGLNTGNLQYRTVKDGYLVTTSEGGRTLRLPNIIRTPLRKYSHLYSFVKSSLNNFLNRFRYKSLIEVFANKYSLNFQNGVQYTFKQIMEINKWCENNNSQLIVIIIPSRIQVDNKYLNSLNIDVKNLDFNKPNQLISDFCNNNQINCVDLLPVLSNHPSIEDCYFKKDNHWTPEGHKIVSEFLSKHLLNSGIIK